MFQYKCQALIKLAFSVLKPAGQVATLYDVVRNRRIRPSGQGLTRSPVQTS